MVATGPGGSQFIKVVPIPFSSGGQEDTLQPNAYYDIGAIVQSLNFACWTAHTAVYNEMVGVRGFVMSSELAQWEYKGEAKLSLYIPETYIPIVGADCVIVLMMNAPLKGVLDGFFTYKSTLTTDDQTWFQVMATGTGTNQVVVKNWITRVAMNCFEMRPYFSSGKLKDVTTLLIGTQNMPIVSELTSSLNNSGLAISGSETVPILTDLSLEEDAVGGFGRPTFVYNPSVLRWVQMVGTIPLTSITWRVYYKDRKNQTRPLYLGPGDSCSLKILFRIN
jgi:hypothetical protein